MFFLYVSASWVLYFVHFTEVMPRRALDAFCRCEHIFATLRVDGMMCRLVLVWTRAARELSAGSKTTEFGFGNGLRAIKSLCEPLGPTHYSFRFATIPRAKRD